MREPDLSPVFVVVLALALGASACVSRAPALEQPVGGPRLTAAVVPERPLAPLLPPAPLPEPPRRICPEVLPAFVFESGSSVITPAQDAVLRSITDCLTAGELAGATVIAVGHTDAVGGELQNLALGLDRALKVKAFLVARGVPEARVLAVSSGELSTAANQPGRRVDLFVAASPGELRPRIGPGPAAILRGR